MEFVQTQHFFTVF